MDYKSQGGPVENQPFMLASMFSWVLFLITAWMSLGVPNEDSGAVIWLIPSSKDLSGITLPIFMHYVMFYMVFIITFIFSTLAFLVYVYHLFINKNENVINGMLGGLAKFHFIPLLCISSLFIIGESLDSTDAKDAHYIFGIIFTILSIGSLIFIILKTQIDSPLYAQNAIKRGAYPCLLALLIYEMCWLIYAYRQYLLIEDLRDGDEDAEDNILNWIKGCNIAFSLIIGILNMGLAFYLKDILLSCINLLIYIGMTVNFFKCDKEAREQYFDNDAAGIIDIIMMVLAFILTVFLVLKAKSILSNGNP